LVHNLIDARSGLKKQKTQMTCLKT
jgi:hypothetical protein